MKFLLTQYQQQKTQVDGKSEVIPKGDVLYVHIPSGEKLLHEDCIASYRQAGAFFARYFGDTEIKAIMCSSWLLCKKLESMLSPQSGIMLFQNDFNIFEEKPNNTAIITRVFGNEKADINEYPEKSSLQKAVKYALLNGEQFSEGIWILKEKMFCVFNEGQNEKQECTRRGDR